MINDSIRFLDCTLRDGGYYNEWDFPQPLIEKYLQAMVGAGVDTVELGLRSLKNDGFKGACAYTTDNFLNSLDIPNGLTIGVMVNASELVNDVVLEEVLNKLFPAPSSESKVDLVRIACHVHEFEEALEAYSWLKEQGFIVGFNLMQIANCDESEIKSLAKLASQHQIDVLYFADSMGSMKPDDTVRIIKCLRSEWKGVLGIHTHDNLGLALSNTLRALDEGVTWLDSTVTGMGRGPGNARTEELAIELAAHRNKEIDVVPLLSLVREHFKPMQFAFGWGTNPFYYLSGKYRIHPTYVQEMLNDSRYDEEDILAVIDRLQQNGGKKFDSSTLDSARHFYHSTPSGNWSPASLLKGREVLLLGTGPSTKKHRVALEQLIKDTKPFVLALNTQTVIEANLIDMRVACHPVRILADCDTHTKLPQPLITPYSMLPENVQLALSNKEIFDFGLIVKDDTFSFENSCCTIPTSLVAGYALAIAASGQVSRVLMAGFDGYPGEDLRNHEMSNLLKQFQEANGSVEIQSITSSRYDIPCKSIYGVS